MKNCNIGNCFSLFLIWIAYSSNTLAQCPAETRQYQVTVDGHASGRLRIDYIPGTDESLKVDVHSDVEVNVLFIRYSYQLHVLEDWSRGNVRAVVSESNDNGAFTHCCLASKQNVFQKQINNGATHVVPACLGSTTLAVLPQFDSVGHAPLFDVDTGKIVSSQWKKVGTESMRLNRDDKVCEKFVVTGDFDTQVWFDSERRLVRQSFQEEGSEIVIIQIVN